MAKYQVTGPAGVGFETRDGTFFYVQTLFVESAMERARQEWLARPFRSAAIYEAGKRVRMIDEDDTAYWWDTAG